MNAPGRPSPSAPLTVAAGLVAIQGTLTILFGISEAVNTSSGRFVMGATTALFFVAYGVALMVCAWGLWTCRPWSRGPVLLAQLMWLGLAWNFRDGSLAPLAVFGAVMAIVVLVGLLHPESVDALNRDEHRR